MRVVSTLVAIPMGTLGLLPGQNVGIGTSTPHPSARLDVVDNQRGVLIPRLTTAERDAITNPARSLLIYNIDCDVYQYYVPGTGWVTLLNTGTGGAGGGGGGGSIIALNPTNVTSSGYTAHWTLVAGAISYTIRTYDNCSGANPTLVNTTTVSGNYSSAPLSVPISLCGDMCYEVEAIVNTGSACGGSGGVITSNRVPVPLSASGCTSPNTWTQLTAGPIPPPGRENHIIIAHQGYIYMGFGNGGNGVCLNDWWRWNPCTNTWQQLNSPPNMVGGLPFAFAVGNYIYVGGGGWGCAPAKSAVYRYDPSSNSWSSVKPLPVAVHGAPGASDGTYGYVIGGSTDNNFPVTATSNQLYRYDPASNSWTAIATYPAGPRWCLFMTYHQGRLWMGKGMNGSCTSQCYAYDLTTNSWNSLPNYPNSGFDDWAVGYNQRIYVTGGHSDCSGSCTNIYYYYDMATNNWISMATFTGGNRNNLHLTEFNGILYGNGGHGSGGSCGPFMRDWWGYCP